MCLAVGFDNGTIEVRKHRTGELLCEVQLARQDNGQENPVVKLFYYDYRMQGNKQIVAVGRNGLIQGYTVQVSNAQIQAQIQGEEKLVSNELLALNKRKIELQNKMRDLETKQQEFWL